jgi:ABC-type phosphate/phosphonate transport system substrate-binding protein
MISSLMMYRAPEIEGAIDRYWTLIRGELAMVGIDSPVGLAQEAEAFSVWQNPGLVLSQTCGMPYRRILHSDVTLVGTPDFGLCGCPPGYYRSAFVARRDDPRQTLAEFGGAVFAYNMKLSQSGFAAPWHHARGQGVWFETLLETGAHGASARAVAYGRAGIAALDAMTWRLLQQHEDFTNDLRVLEWTEPTPGLPYITALPREKRGDIFNAVARAIERLEDVDRAATGLKGLVYITPGTYRAIPDPPANILEDM